MLYSIDRIVGDVAVLVDESGENHTVPTADLPEEVREGIMVRLDGGAYTVDADVTAERKARVLSLQEKLRRRKS